MLLPTVLVMTRHRIKVEIVHRENEVKKVLDLNINNRSCTIHRLREAVWLGGHLLYAQHVHYNFILVLFVGSALHENT